MESGRGKKVKAMRNELAGIEAQLLVVRSALVQQLTELDTIVARVNMLEESADNGFQVVPVSSNESAAAEENPRAHQYYVVVVGRAAQPPGVVGINKSKRRFVNQVVPQINHPWTRIGDFPKAPEAVCASFARISDAEEFWRQNRPEGASERAPRHFQ